MTNALSELRLSLEQAVDLIDSSLVLPTEVPTIAKKTGSQGTKLDFSQASSLLEKCDNVNNQYNESKPIIRIIHHFACSGGSLVSKCLSAMPNVFLLSEVHPHSDLQRYKENPEYSPSDLAKLAFYADVPEQKKLAEKIFIEAVKVAYAHIHERGGILVLRDHSHSDYCTDGEIRQNTVAKLLGEHFQVNSIVTLRNPIDSYLSLVSNGWVSFQPKTFDEYCNRINKFLEPFTSEQITLYENFVQKPQEVLQKICSTLQVSFDDNFEFLYRIFNITGDSGRKEKDIGLRTRRECTAEFSTEIKQSKSFKKLQQTYNFI
jgi:hypothetical protein